MQAALQVSFANWLALHIQIKHILLSRVCPSYSAHALPCLISSAFIAPKLRAKVVLRYSSKNVIVTGMVFACRRTSPSPTPCSVFRTFSCLKLDFSFTNLTYHTELSFRASYRLFPSSELQKSIAGALFCFALTIHTHTLPETQTICT